MSDNVLVVAEQSDGKFKSISHQMLGEASRLAQQLGGHVEAGTRQRQTGGEGCWHVQPGT